jgi:hypothetical protein
LKSGKGYDTSFNGVSEETANQDTDLEFSMVGRVCPTSGRGVEYCPRVADNEIGVCLAFVTSTAIAMKVLYLAERLIAVLEADEKGGHVADVTILVQLGCKDIIKNLHYQQD